MPVILMVARLTLLLRRRSADQFQVIDSVAAFQIAVTGAAIVAAVCISRLERLKAVFFGTPVTGLIAFYAICLLSALWSPVPLFTGYRALEYLVQVAVIMAALLFSVSLAQAERRLFTIGAIVVALDLASSVRPWGASFSPESFHSASYGISAGIPACYALGEACTRGGGPRRRLLLIAFGFMGAVGLSTSSGSIIALCIAVAVIGLLSRNLVLGATVLLAISLLFMAPSELRNSVLFPNKDATMIETMSGRTGMWQTFLPLIAERPILGGGMSVAARLYGSAYNINSHNSLIAALLSTGLIGALVLLAGLAALGWQSIRAFLAARPGSLGCIGALTFALLNSNTFAFFGEDWCVPSVMFICMMGLEVIFVSGAFDQTRGRSPRRFGELHGPRPCSEASTRHQQFFQ